MSMMLLPTLTPFLSRTTRNTWTSLEGGRQSSRTLTSVTRMQVTRTVTSGHVWHRVNWEGEAHVYQYKTTFVLGPACCPTKCLYCVMYCSKFDCNIQITVSDGLLNTALCINMKLMLLHKHNHTSYCFVHKHEFKVHKHSHIAKNMALTNLRCNI